MNTIPTTFNTGFPPYTVVGGKDRLAWTGLSAVLLNRGGCYGRRNLFRNFEKAGFDSVVSIESSPEHYDVEELAEQFPFVRFILLKQEITMGEQINLAAAETDTPLFFVLWNNLNMVAGGTAGRMAERLCVSADLLSQFRRPDGSAPLASPPTPKAGEDTRSESGADGEGAQADGEKKSPFKQLCTVPFILNSRFETVPTLIVPAVKGKKIQAVFLPPRREGLPSLYPFDGVGIYDRERFIRIGGFDGSLKRSHWQLMDFGFRAHLWGEEIISTQTVKLSYDSTIPSEDNTPDENYFRFYLKNIAPVFHVDHARLPLRCFPGYLLKAGEAPLAAWEGFSESRQWVKTNRFRWRCDARSIPDRWDNAALAETAGIGEA